MAIARMWYSPADGGYVAIQTDEGPVYRLDSRHFSGVTEGFVEREKADASLCKPIDAGGAGRAPVGIDRTTQRGDGTIWLHPEAGPIRLELTAVESATLVALIRRQ